jgi:hypothetical protein
LTIDVENAPACARIYRVVFVPGTLFLADQDRSPTESHPGTPKRNQNGRSPFGLFLIDIIYPCTRA